MKQSGNYECNGCILVLEIQYEKYNRSGAVIERVEKHVSDNMNRKKNNGEKLHKIQIHTRVEIEIKLYSNCIKYKYKRE